MPRPVLCIRSGTPSIADLRVKLSRLVYHHDQLKVSYRQMSSHIRRGLLEAEDVFASLSIQLMKLVGLKSVEMAGEGRFSSVVVINDSNRSKEHARASTETASKVRLETKTPDEDFKAGYLEEEHILARANKAGRELMEKQKMQLMFLVRLLKQIEGQVNASQDDIFQSLSDHQTSMKLYFQKAAKYVSAIHQDCETDDMRIMLILLKNTYDRVDMALGAVEIGVKELMRKLAEKMCGPMVHYVNDLRYEMTAGTYSSIPAIMEEFSEAIRVQGLELEEARKKAKEAEKGRLDTLSKLKGTLERMRKLEEASNVYVERKKRPVQLNVTEKSMKYEEVEEDQAKDEKLLWELLRKRRKLQAPDSPFCPNGLLGIGTGDKNLKAIKIQAMKPPLTNCKPPPPTRRSTRLNPQTPRAFPSLPLGSSPSVATQQLITRSRFLWP